MATEPQRSENMSGAPSSSESAPHRPAQTDVSADAALILAALGRMEAVVRDERAAFTRLRVMLGDMAQAIARGKTVADSETAATLLDELEHRVDAMIEIAGHDPVAASAATPDPQPPSTATLDAGAATPAIQRPAEHDQVPTVSDVVSRLGSDEETPPAAGMPVDDTAGSAPTVAMLTAMVEALRDSISTAAPAPETPRETPAPPAADVAAQPLDAPPQFETSSGEITEQATPTAEIAAAAEAAHAIEAPQAGEAAQTAAPTHTVGAAEAADIPPPAEPAPDQSPFVAMLNARVEALHAFAAAFAPEHDAPPEIAQPASPATEAVAQPLDLTPPPETSSIESAETATPAPEIVQAAAAAHTTGAPQAGAATPASDAIHTADVAEAAPIPGPAVTDLHESALLASLEQMGARPFPPPDEGTAVIFAPRPELEFLPEFAREPAALAETAAAPEQAAAPQPATEPAEIAMAEIIADLTRGLIPEPALEAAAAGVEPAMPIEPTAEPAPAQSDMAAATTTESDFDPADFLFGPEPEPDPAAFLLDPAPPQPPAPRAKAAVPPQPEFAAPQAQPAAENPDAVPPAEPDPPAQTAPEPAPRDPLHALKALSENEKLALFS